MEGERRSDRIRLPSRRRPVSNLEEIQLERYMVIVGQMRDYLRQTQNYRAIPNLTLARMNAYFINMLNTLRRQGSLLETLPPFLLVEIERYSEAVAQRLIITNRHLEENLFVL